MRKVLLVSVIIPSYNSEKTITRCLESIQLQTYPHIEIIVVDKNSSDKTRQIAKKYTKHVFVHGPERSAQVNFGTKKARGTYIYRVDSDFIVDPDVIFQCVEKCEKEHLDGIAVHNTSAERLGFWADVRKFERNTYIDDDLIVAVRFFTKKSWEEVGGFDETLYGPEDYDFHNRFVTAGFRWGRIRAMEKHLGEPKSLSDIWKKHFYYGKQMVSYFKKHPRVATKQFNPLRISYLRHFWTLLAHPMIAIGLLIMTVVKFSAGGLGFISEWFTWYATAENQVKKLYGNLGWVSVFTRIRFWTGSFVQVEQEVPANGKILDLGCGYGIFANYLAVCSPQRKVIGIDTDGNKIKFADRGIPNTSFWVGDATKMHLKNLDAILLLDVLHHLNSYEDQERLIHSCMRMLTSKGRLFIIEVNNKPFWKLVLGRTTDALLYVGQPVYYRYKNEMVSMLSKCFGKNYIIAHQFTHNPFPQVLYICQKR